MIPAPNAASPGFPVHSATNATVNPRNCKAIRAKSAGFQATERVCAKEDAPFPTEGRVSINLRIPPRAKLLRLLLRLGGAGRDRGRLAFGGPDHHVNARLEGPGPICGGGARHRHRDA